MQNKKTAGKAGCFFVLLFEDFFFYKPIKISKKDSADDENKSNHGAKFYLFIKQNCGNQKGKKGDEIGKSRNFRSVFRTLECQRPKKIGNGIYNDSKPKEAKPLCCGKRNPVLGKKAQNSRTNGCNKPDDHHGNVLVIIEFFIENGKKSVTGGCGNAAYNSQKRAFGRGEKAFGRKNYYSEKGRKHCGGF